MTTLKDAQKSGKIDQFIKEREKDTPPADKERFDKTLKSMASEKSSKVRGTSKPDASES